MKASLHKLGIIFLAVFGILTLTNSPASAAFIPADILWVVDTSGSMSGDIAEVKARIQDFNTAMVNAGIDANYGLVEFGGSSGNGYNSNTATLYQDITDYATFIAAGGAFSKTSASGGGTEKGSYATLLGLNTATFRSGSVINVILITDEDDDSSLADFNSADAALTAKNALFNFIGVPGTDNTDSRYGVLASNHGGYAFDIYDFRNDPENFFNTFIQYKVQEITEHNTIPEPASMSLLSMGLLGLAGLRKKRS